MSARQLLVVDDHPEIRSLLSEVLAEEGHAIATARSGLEAVAILEAGLVPDVILADARMPDLDGLALMAWVRESPVHRHARLVLMSASPPERPAVRPDAFLRKPFDLEALFAALES